MTASGADTRRLTDAGFSLLELLIATLVVMTVTGAVITLLSPAHGTYAAQSEAAEMQQRLRAGVDSLQRDLAMAGAGTYLASAAGPLVYHFAALLPHAVGTLVPGSPDSPNPSAITIMYVPPSAAQTTTKTDLSSESVDLKVNQQPGCPLGDALCGFRQGMRVLLFDALGDYDVFTVTSVQADAMRVQHRDNRFTTPYPAGAFITEVVSRTFYLDAAERRLYSYDAYRSNLPLLDNVVGLRFDYLADPSPPGLRGASAGPVAPLTTYGPRPPPPGSDNTNDDWAAGENCVFTQAGGVQIARLPDWGAGSEAGGLVALAYPQLRDGPWCPGRTNAAGAVLPNRFDADLLRVRRVRVTLRVQVGSEALRGTNPVGRILFVNPGTARTGEQFIADEEVQFEVAPTNLNAAR